MSTIAKIAYSNDKRNKTQSILIMISIFLSTMLLTIICTYAYGLIKTKKANAALDYGNYYGICLNVDSQQLQEMQRRSEIIKLGLVANAGYIDSRKKVNVVMADENAADMSNLSIQLLSGTLPEDVDEIAAQAEFFESMGYGSAAPGDTIRLPYRRNMEEKFVEKEFRISGILRESRLPVSQKAYTVYTSAALYEAGAAEGDRRYTVMFSLAEGVVPYYDDAQEVIDELAESCGIDRKNVTINDIYLLFMLDPGYETISICGGIALIVIILSVVVIYNIFQVGIVQRIQEYGKIRALGATKRQMRRLIYKEGLYLAAGSIPAGVLAGFAAAWVTFRFIMHQGRETAGIGEYQEVGIFSLPVLLFGALLAFLTVCLALRPAMKIVARISPVEAIRCRESTRGRKTGLRKGKMSVSVLSMAAANVSADRGRTAATILTMGLSCVLFVILANCVGNIDSQFEAKKSVPYGRFQINLDYSMEDKAYPENNLDAVLKDNPLDRRLIEEISSIHGVTKVHTMDLLLAEIKGRKQELAVFDEDYFNLVKRNGGGIGTLNYADALKEDVFYYCWSHFLEENGYALDEKLTVKITNGTDICEASGIVKGSFGVADTSWAITKEQYERMGFSGASTGWLWVDCAEQDEAAVRQSLEELLADIDHVELSAYQDALDVSLFSSRVMKLSCYLFLAIIGLIGFMNLADTMIMNIITKKQEYGILQAVGMTNRQLNTSLQLQGLLFTAGTMIVAIAAGLPIGYGIFLYAKENGYFGMNVYHIPVLEIVAMAVLIGLLQVILSYLLSRNLKKESLVERIRYQG